MLCTLGIFLWIYGHIREFFLQSIPTERLKIYIVHSKMNCQMQFINLVPHLQLFEDWWFRILATLRWHDYFLESVLAISCCSHSRHALPFCSKWIRNISFTSTKTALRTESYFHQRFIWIWKVIFRKLCVSINLQSSSCNDFDSKVV